MNQSINKSRIWLSSPHLGINEQKYVQSAFDSNWVAPLGPNVDGFELDIANYLQSEVHSTALSSGTAAIHLGLQLLGVQKNDIVLVQSFTFCGTTNPVAYLNAEIVLIDSESTTWNMCPQALEEALKKYQAKAIIPVHLYGMPANMTAIQTLSQKFGVPIIEDAAEALGSEYQGRKCGTFGSIYPKRNLSKLGKAKYIHPYLFRNLSITDPYQVWAIDITYIPM